MSPSTRTDEAMVDQARRDIDEALNAVIDPCSVAAGVPAGLKDMGLVRDVEVVVEDGRASTRIAIAVTHPSCFMAPIFLQQVAEKVGAVPAVADVTVSLDHDADWMPEDMSTSYRDELAAHRASSALPVAEVARR